MSKESDLKADYLFMRYNIINKLDSYKNVPERLKLDIIQILNIYERCLPRDTNKENKK